VCSVCVPASYFPYLYQRSVYLDHLLVPEGWWANPALIAHVNNRTLFTSNVLPLGNRYLISDIRLLMPVKNIVTIGVGILGAGDYRTGSSSTSFADDGFSYRSSFAFQRPRIQVSVAGTIPWAGSFGILGSFGTDVADYTTPTFSPGINVGWLSPELGIPLQLSISGMFIQHDNGERFGETCVKLGVRYQSSDSLWGACAEYTVSPSDNGFGLITPAESNYDVAKILATLRVWGAWAFLAGVSSDLSYPYRNGTMVHAGIENMRTDNSFFFGGYEVGARFGADWSVLHRLWLGIDLPMLKKQVGEEG
jgi:hypothetical protein